VSIAGNNYLFSPLTFPFPSTSIITSPFSSLVPWNSVPAMPWRGGLGQCEPDSRVWHEPQLVVTFYVTQDLELASGRSPRFCLFWKIIVHVIIESWKVRRSNCSCHPFAAANLEAILLTIPNGVCKFYGPARRDFGPACFSFYNFGPSPACSGPGSHLLSPECMSDAM